MITLAIALIIIGTFAFVAHPIFRRSDEFDVAFVGLTDPVVEDLMVQRDATYAAIKDLENDHAMGKLSDNDYRSLRVKYESKAVAILQELDGLQGARQNGSLVTRERSIEEEVERLRRASTGGGKCSKCNTAHAPDDVFCAKCGASLRGVRCPTCGKRAALGDKFCGNCGSAI